MLDDWFFFFFFYVHVDKHTWINERYSHSHRARSASPQVSAFGQILVFLWKWRHVWWNLDYEKSSLLLQRCTSCIWILSILLSPGKNSFIKAKGRRTQKAKRDEKGTKRKIVNIMECLDFFLKWHLGSILQMMCSEWLRPNQHSLVSLLLVPVTTKTWKTSATSWNFSIHSLYALPDNNDMPQDSPVTKAHVYADRFCKLSTAKGYIFSRFQLQRIYHTFQKLCLTCQCNSHYRP